MRKLRDKEKDLRPEKEKLGPKIPTLMQSHSGHGWSPAECVVHLTEEEKRNLGLC